MLLSTISVTSSLDTVDANDGVTTLREAIEAANTQSGHDTIVFDIGGAGVHTIQPLSALPAITDSVTIDATTQSGFDGMPLIELDGSLAGISANGLHIVAGNSTVRGLAINRFVRDGILIQNGGGNLIVGNFIGTDVTGTVALGNNTQGIRIDNSSENVIGGTTAADRNVISGNNANGVAVIGIYSNGNVVQGNYVGTDVTGTVDLGNRLNGLLLGQGTNNLFGGTVAGAGNVISGNNGHGVWISGAANNNSVQGNYIGTDASGTVALGNSLNGVYLFDRAQFNLIGGDSAAAGNVIAFNGGNGVAVFQSTTLYNTIRANSIHSNGGIGIDLGIDGVTPNDADDADAGPNMFQNYPVLSEATENTLETHVVGSFDGAADVSVTIDFYANAADGSSQTWLGSTVVTTDAAGHAAFDVSLSVLAAGGDLVTATATDAMGSTSEFSAGVTVVSVDPPAPEPEPEPAPAPTLEERIGGLQDRVNELVAEGVLKKGNGKALNKTLNNALKQLEKGKTRSAMMMLKATSHKVRALMRSDRLSSEVGRELRQELHDVIGELREEVHNQQHHHQFRVLSFLFSRHRCGRLLHHI